MQHYVSVTYEEFLVGVALEKNGWHVYVPTKDMGVDLLAERDGRSIRLQVKGSRSYPTPMSKHIPWASWTQLRPDALRNAVDIGVDLFVFVVYAPNDSGPRIRIEPFYVIIAPADLEARLASSRPGKAERAVAWYRDGKELREVRGLVSRKAGDRFKENAHNFSFHLNNWSLCDQASGGRRRYRRRALSGARSPAQSA
jgi:hypothetical protein